MKITNKKETMVFVLLILMAVFTKYYQYNFLPPKYFYDSSAILAMTNNNFSDEGLGYAFTARTFVLINIFGFTTLLEWSIFFAITYNIIIFIFMRKFIARSNKFELIYFIASIFLLNLYVLNMSKEIIQFTIFIVIYCICKNKRLGNLSKTILVTLAFYIESLYFRNYYILMSIFMITIYFLLSKCLKEKQMKPLSVIIKILVVLFLVLNIARIVSYEDYMDAIMVRHYLTRNRTTSLDAVTLIQNTIENSSGNIFLFMVNYVLNSIRMLVPLELLFKGIKYIPFIIYQIYIVVQLLIAIKKLNKHNIVFISCMIAYLLGSFIFEPDFGSLVRHESTTFFIMAHLISLNKEKSKNIKIYIRNGEKKYDPNIA